MRGTRRPASVWISRRHYGRSAAWIVRWIDPATGRERSRTAGPNRDLARELAAETRRQLQRQISGTKPQATILELADWLPGWMPGATPETVRNTTRSLRRLAAITENRLLSRVAREQLLHYQARRLADGAAPATINKELREISSALTLAVDAGYLELNPLLHWRRRRLTEPERRLRIVEPEEIEKLLEVARRPEMDSPGNDQTAGLLILGWYMGLRRSEVCHLEWDAVELQTRTLYIQNYLGHEPHLTKNRKVRATPLRAPAAEWLAAHWERIEKVVAHGTIRPKIQTVFSWPDGRPINKHWLSRQVAKLVAAAAIRPATYHDLRRSFSTLAQ